MTTDMDYEQKYKKALERAREYLEAENFTEMADVFPELSESEDERISKYLIDELKAAKSVGELKFTIPQPTREECIAYLEKQKPISTEETELNSIAFLEQMGYTCIPPGKEQKPAHTAKEMWKEMRLAVYAQASGNRHEPNYSDDSTKMFSLCDIDEIFEKIGNSTIELQPAKWSEEDEKMLQSIIKDFRAGKVSTIGQEQWLKSLRPQPQHRDTYYDIIHSILAMLKDIDFMQITPEHRVSLLNDIRVRCKHADEWADILDEPQWKPSEDEERLINTSISFLKDFADKGYENAVECIDWLKSLRPQPHWKPSEEQMYALAKAVTLYGSGLDSLYQDLKKLM